MPNLLHTYVLNIDYWMTHSANNVFNEPKLIFCKLSNCSEYYWVLPTIQLNTGHLLTQTVLFLTVQFSISHLFAFSLNVKQFYSTHKYGPIRCYHCERDWSGKSDSINQLTTIWKFDPSNKIKPCRYYRMVAPLGLWKNARRKILNWIKDFGLKFHSTKTSNLRASL